MQDRLLQIFKNYGWENQIRKLQEELDELKKEVILFEYGIGDIDNLMKEYADTMNVLEQFKLNYELGEQEIEEARLYKITRQEERIKEGK